MKKIVLEIFQDEFSFWVKKNWYTKKMYVKNVCDEKLSFRKFVTPFTVAITLYIVGMVTIGQILYIIEVI